MNSPPKSTAMTTPFCKLRAERLHRNLPLCLGMAIFLPACSGPDGHVPVYSVTGKVAVAGEVPVGALVVLYPAKTDPGAQELRPSGKVGTDGAFRLTTYDADDGAPAGEYTATLLWNKLVKKGQDYAAGPNLVPVEYATRETSSWKLTVDAKPNELLPLDIKK
jgi:hypothetical protein